MQMALTIRKKEFISGSIQPKTSTRIQFFGTFIKQCRNRFSIFQFFWLESLVSIETEADCAHFAGLWWIGCLSEFTETMQTRGLASPGGSQWLSRQVYGTVTAGQHAEGRTRSTGRRGPSQLLSGTTRLMLVSGRAIPGSAGLGAEPIGGTCRGPLA